MTTLPSLTLDELELIAQRAVDRDEPAAGAAELVAVVEHGGLADPQEGVVALGMAAELLFAADDMAGSLELTDRAIDRHRAQGSAPDYALMFRARVLFLLDRPDEAMAELTPLRPLLTTEPEAAHEIAEALLAGHRGDLANQWLTEAVGVAREAVPETEPLDEAGEVATAVLYALLTERHAVRHELDLPHDSLDEMAEELETAIEDEERRQLEAELSVPVLFFPRAEFDELAARLADVARVMGPTWDEHRADLERALVARSAAGFAAGCRIVPGSAAELAALVEARGIDDPLDDDVLADYVDDLDDRSTTLPWPPARNEVCWCGSDAKYKKCCLPRSRG